MRSAFLGLSLLVSGAGVLGVACGDDDSPGPGVGGSSSGGTSGSGGAAGSGGRAGSGGSAGSAGAAGSAGSGGAGGSAGGAGAAGAAGSGGSSGADGGDAGVDEADAGAFTLSSTGFDDNAGCGPDGAADACDFFPANSTNFAPGTNTSPELSWTGAPAGTQSFAIALHDLDFLQNGDPFTHWVMWNIPGSTTGLPEGLPDGATPAPPAPAGSQQVSQGDDNGFFGSGACGNVYEFVLYALDTATFTPADDTDPDDVEDALDDSDAVLATTTVRARSGPCD
jgi:Raf kinase inhibitor-like YbhB/YbcL family protein